MDKMKMPPFPGSVFITDARPKGRVDLPRPLDMPLFMNKMNKVRKNYEPHRRYIEEHKKLYECPEVFGAEGGQQNHPSPVPDLERCPKTLSKLGRTNFSGAPWKLPPNRYKVKEVCCSKEPLQGAFWSRLERTDKTLPGRFANPKFTGEPKFYDLPSCVDWKSSCAKHKGIFLANARNRQPTTRFMVSDLALCWKDPKLPGPAHYCPNKHTLKYRNSKVKKTPKKIIFRYLPNSIVPEPELDFHRHVLQNLSTPGPGRFEPSDVACTCHPKKILDLCIWEKIERQKRRRFRRLPYKKIKADLYCSLPAERNIKGHGHTYIFKTKMSRKATKSKTQTAKAEKLEKLHIPAKYINMINNPERMPLYVKDDLEVNFRTIRFNCIYKPILRKKLKENKKIAFLSGTPRFPGEEVIKVSKESKKQPKPKKEDFEEAEERPLRAVTSRNLVKKALSFGRAQSLCAVREFKKPEKPGHALSQLPDRIKKSEKRSVRENIFSFAPLPPPRLLLREDEIGRFDSFELILQIKEIAPEIYFKDEYTENFVVKLKKDSLGQRPLDILSIVE